MVLDALGEVLGEAVGILVSPLPIVAVILMLFTAGKANSLAFLAGWIVGLAVVGAVVLSLSDAADVSSDSDASDGSGGVLVVIGALLIVAAVRRWRQRPHAGEAVTPPKWMSRHRRTTTRRRLAARRAPRGREPEEPAARGRGRGDDRSSRAQHERHGRHVGDLRAAGEPQRARARGLSTRARRARGRPRSTARGRGSRPTTPSSWPCCSS